MALTLPVTTKHSTHLGVQIHTETYETGEKYFVFFDKQGYRHVRNTAKKGGTLAALKEDIRFYVSQGWA